MMGSKTFKIARNEGYEAGKSRKKAEENPYNYIYQSVQAYAWDEGFKEAKKWFEINA